MINNLIKELNSSEEPIAEELVGMISLASRNENKKIVLSDRFNNKELERVTPIVNNWKSAARNTNEFTRFVKRAADGDVNPVEKIDYMNMNQFVNFLAVFIRHENHTGKISN